MDYGSGHTQSPYYAYTHTLIDMFHGLKRFFQNRVTRGSFLWNSLASVGRELETLRRWKVYFLSLALPFSKIENLNRFDSKTYSQNGEDGILEAIFRKIGTTNKVGVEFGVEDGFECNTRFLIEKRGWTCLQMDGGNNNPPSIKQEFITAENINDLFKKYNVPKTFDLLSIDIDGNDYWVWKAIDSQYCPAVVVIEYNGKFPPSECKVIEYQPDFQWDRTDYYGASLGALVKLAGEKGYTLVGCDGEGVNSFFVRDDKIEGNFIRRGIEDLYRLPRFGKKSDNGGWPSGPRKMITI